MCLTLGMLRCEWQDQMTSEANEDRSVKVVHGYEGESILNWRFDQVQLATH